MKMARMLLPLLTAVLLLTACGRTAELPAAVSLQESTAMRETAAAQEGTDMNKTTQELQTMQMTVGAHTFLVTPEENETARAFMERFPLTLEMSELNGNEKYHYLKTALPSSPEQVGSIRAGDVMLYGDTCIVVFYKSFSTPYRYTRIGHIDDADTLAEALGSGNITAEFSRSESLSSEYTVQDMQQLSDFLLKRPTATLAEKEYDLNHDGRWDVFDLALMKRRLQDQRQTFTYSAGLDGERLPDQQA